MADNDASADDKTEAPSQKRLQQAREQGQIPVSRDVTMFASLGGAALGCLTLAPPLADRLLHQGAMMLGEMDRVSIDGGVFAGHLMQTGFTAGLLLASVALPAVLGTIGSTLLQTQFYLAPSPIRFQPERVNPMAGLARMFSAQHLMEFGKSVLRLAILGVLIWVVLRHAAPAAISVLRTDVTRLLPVTMQLVQQMGRPVLVVMALFAVADIFLVRFQHTKKLRMTREEVKREMKESDGDAFIKSKLKRIRQQRSRRRMMAKVKKADVVITNPTHYAIALTYERGGQSAPRVIAKGVDFLAARIREEADKHAVPIVPNPPLARALYLVDLDQEIPAEHYRAVAEVIAFVWKLKNRLGGAAVRS